MNTLYAIITLLLISCPQGIKNTIENQQNITVVRVNPLEFDVSVTNSLLLKRKIILKGTINNTIKITMYLNEQEDPCGGDATIIYAMYKYDTQEEWMLLNVTRNTKKKGYCMVEDNFTGVLFLEEHNNFFAGHWVSPDTKKQYRVLLENICNSSGLECNETVIEKLDEVLFDDLIYNKNDC